MNVPPTGRGSPGPGAQLRQGTRRFGVCLLLGSLARPCRFCARVHGPGIELIKKAIALDDSDPYAYGYLGCSM